MGFIDKVKGFFYDEDEIEEEVEVPVKREIPKKKQIIVDDEKEEEISERELFKAERTFNFPMDMDEDEEEPDFTPIKKMEEEKQEYYKPSTSTRSTYKSSTKIVTEKKEEKKFKPTPIISPIYGIIDGEYQNSSDKIEDSLSKTRELGNTKRVDFDEVRQKAYGIVKNQEEEIKSDENKGIFFNLDEEKEDIPKEDEQEEEDIKITYNDVDYEEDDEEEIEVPKITRLNRNKKNAIEKQEDDSILSETKEQDLFNLIDNMYNSEEEEED